MKTVRVFIILCISTLASMMGMGILLPILPIYARDLGASGTMLGIVFSSFALTMALFNPIVGRLSDRLGYKRLIVLGLGFHIPVALSYIIATKSSHLILIRLAEGMLFAMVQTVSMAYAGSIASKDKEGSYMGVFNTFIYFGLGIGPLLGGILSDLFSIRMPFYAMAASMTVALFLVVFFVPGEVGEEKEREYKELLKSLPPIKMVLRSSFMKGMIIYSFIISLGQSGLFAFLPIVTQREQISTGRIGILTSIIMLLAGLLQIPFGYLANIANKLLLVTIGVLLIAVDLAYIPLCSSFWSFLLLSVIAGLGGAICVPAASAMVVRGGKSLGLGFALGIFNLAMGLGMIAGPVLSGLIMDHFGLDQIFYVSAILFILAAVAIYHFIKDIKNL